jgi:SAM-dependent methyltransferase
MPACPVCLGASFSVLMSAADLAREAQIRDRFIGQRVTKPLSQGERKDLTDFFHNERADLIECASCGVLLRSECGQPAGGSDSGARSYSEDEYDPEAIDRIYPKYVRAFAAKEQPYRVLLPAGAQVVELGSHYGAFLEIAANWGWHAIGVDIGEDSSRYARSHGFDVRSCELAECSFDDSSLDGLFIWNCFDQIKDSRPVLEEARRLLKRGGLLAVRTPNGLFYTRCEALLRDPRLPAAAGQFLIEAMAYNNLLAFPYQYGYNAAALGRLIEPFGFRCEGTLNSELLTLPLPEDPDWVLREERTIQEGVHLLAHSVLRNREGELAGPWIELWFRRDGTLKRREPLAPPGYNHRHG